MQESVVHTTWTIYGHYGSPHSHTPFHPHLLHAGHDVVEPSSSLTAGCALATALMLVEVAQAGNGIDDVSTLILRGGQKVQKGVLALPPNAEHSVQILQHRLSIT